MELIKIIGVGLVTAITALVLKSSKPELAFAVPEHIKHERRDIKD